MSCWGALILLSFIFMGTAQAEAREMIKIPSGQYLSFFKGEGNEETPVPSFYLDKYPVTNKEFDLFLLKNPNYQKAKVPKLFADVNYLKHWDGDRLSPKLARKISDIPVVNVSWFVAKKFCEDQGKRLPAIAEWEYASDGQSPAAQKQILEWYGKTSEETKLIDPKKLTPNKFGVYGMHGVVWELVDDFITVMISSDSRTNGDRTDGFFCGGGSVGSRDASKYATFMRYAFRSGLRGNYSGENLGFRCAKNIEEK